LAPLVSCVAADHRAHERAAPLLDDSETHRSQLAVRAQRGVAVDTGSRGERGRGRQPVAGPQLTLAQRAGELGDQLQVRRRPAIMRDHQLHDARLSQKEPLSTGNPIGVPPVYLYVEPSHFGGFSISNLPCWKETWRRPVRLPGMAQNFLSPQ
jgi:hypothetical protein